MFPAQSAKAFLSMHNWPGASHHANNMKKYEHMRIFMNDTLFISRPVCAKRQLVNSL